MRRAVRSEVRQSALNMRTTEALRKHLEFEASKSGRTLSHEVEYRLERSFTEDGTYTTATNAAILRDIAAVFQIIGFDRSAGANKASRMVLNAVLERIVAAHLPDPATTKSVSLMPTVNIAQDYPIKDHDIIPVSDESLSKITAKCLGVVDSVLDSSALADLPPVVTKKGAPFGFHSDPFTPTGIMAKIAGKPAGILSDLEEKKKS